MQACERGTGQAETLSGSGRYALSWSGPSSALAKLTVRHVCLFATHIVTNNSFFSDSLKLLLWLLRVGLFSLVLGQSCKDWIRTSYRTIALLAISAAPDKFHECRRRRATPRNWGFGRAFGPRNWRRRRYRERQPWRDLARRRSSYCWPVRTPASS